MKETYFIIWKGENYSYIQLIQMRQKNGGRKIARQAINSK